LWLHHPLTWLVLWHSVLLLLLLLLQRSVCVFLLL
jgi:hypothetical protein